jgi:ATP-dependent helicase/nuclease subunit A
VSTFAPVDDAARERIKTELDANICVEAGAGTGKTTVLVDRIVEILRTGFATVDEIAVITFTEAAAAELAARVRQDLEQALASASDDVERERIHAALQGLHRAHVETIHAFAAGLLRERPVEAGLDPSFEVLDELAAQLSFDDAYSVWLAELLDGPQPEVVTAIARGFQLAQLRTLVEVVDQHRSLLPLTREAAPRPDIAGLQGELRNAVAEFEELLPDCREDEIARADMDALAAWAKQLAALENDERELERQILFRSPNINPGGGAQPMWNSVDSCRRSKARRQAVKEALQRVKGELRREALTGVIPLAEQFVARYEAERKAAATADFDDLLEWARDLLADSPEARAYFRKRFRTILVDEFQDTDPIQVEIALCIASDDEPGENWLEMRPRPGGLTVVGDPKQSIYRFRRADIAVYDAVRHGPLAGGDVQLVQNFRSVGGVIAWVNGVFDRVLEAEEGVQPANTALHPGPGKLDDESMSICVVHGEPKEKADEIRREEARLLAATIRRVVAEGWLVRDPVSGEERPAEYGDVTVLVPRRTALDLYLDAFRRFGVPVRAEGGRSFFQRQEVRDLANTLLAIDDPLDQIALVASLRSAVFACSDDNLYLHVSAGNRLDYRVPPDGSPESVTEALAVLRDLHDLRSRVSLAQLVRATLEKTKLVEIALSGWDGQQSAANLMKLADRARAFSASGAGGLRGFAQWLTRQRASSDEAEANVAEETDDVVRVMTVHASKGLEFPIVAVANLGTKPSSAVQPVPDRRAHRLHLRIGADPNAFKTPGFDAAWEAEQHQIDAEEKRLLYVALTRARDRLIIPRCSVPDRPGPLIHTLLPSIPEWDPEQAESKVDGCFVLDWEKLPGLPDEDPPLPAEATKKAIDGALKEREAWETARAETIRVARDELAVHPASGDEGDNPVPASFLGADEGALIVGDGPPAEKGEAMHKVLELIDLRDPHDLEKVVRSVCLVAGLEEYAPEVLELCRACLESEAVARALRAERIWREVPYTLRVEDGYATGRIDLVFEEDGELVVLDWKSDTVGPTQVEAAAEAHRPQADAYAKALAASTAKAVKEIVFVFPRARGAASIAPPNTLLKGF